MSDRDFKIIPSKFEIDCVECDRARHAYTADFAFTSLYPGPSGPTGPQGPSGGVSQSYGMMYTLDQNVVMPDGNYVAFSGMTAANLNNITFSDPPSALTVSNTGIYLINMSIDGAVTGNNVDMAQSIFVNGILSPTHSITRHYQQSGDDGSSVLSSLISLTSGDSLTLQLQALPPPFSFDTHNVTVNLVQIS